MNKKNKKISITVGIEDTMSQNDIAFLEERFNVEVIPFSKLVEKGSAYYINLLFFTGGADVNPEMYGEKKGKYTQINAPRDIMCEEVFHKYYNVPKLGICRGSQILTVLNGGKLIQHVSQHAIGGTHKIDVHFEGNNKPSSFNITSTHHQMMYPFNLDNASYNILGWSSVALSNTYLNGDNKEINLPAKFVEPEIVYYPKGRSLAIQGHPEFDKCPQATKDLCLDLITNYLL